MNIISIVKDHHLNIKFFCFLCAWMNIKNHPELIGVKSILCWVPFWVQFHSRLRSIGVESIRAESIRGWAHSEFSPFEVQSIRGWVYSESDPFGVQSHSGLSPFRWKSSPGLDLLGSVGESFSSTQNPVKILTQSTLFFFTVGSPVGSFDEKTTYGNKISCLRTFISFVPQIFAFHSVLQWPELTKMAPQVLVLYDCLKRTPQYSICILGPPSPLLSLYVLYLCLLLRK